MMLFGKSAPDSFGSCLRHCLVHTEHTFIALNKSLYFKANTLSLAIYHPTQALWWLLFLCTQSAVPAEGSGYDSYLSYGINLLTVRRCQSLCEPRLGRRSGLSQAVVGKPKCVSTYPDPTRHIHNHSPLSFPLSMLNG